MPTGITGSRRRQSRFEGAGKLRPKARYRRRVVRQIEPVQSLKVHPYKVPRHVAAHLVVALPTCMRRAASITRSSCKLLRAAFVRLQCAQGVAFKPCQGLAPATKLSFAQTPEIRDPACLLLSSRLTQAKPDSNSTRATGEQQKLAVNKLLAVDGCPQAATAATWQVQLLVTSSACRRDRWRDEEARISRWRVRD